MNEELKPNSHKYRSEQQKELPEKKVEKIVTSPVKVKQKSRLKRFADVFISEDISNVKSFLISDILVPEIKKALRDVVANGADMLLYGEKKLQSRAPKVSYRKYYDDEQNERRKFGKRTVRYDFGNYEFNNRGEAEAVLERMKEIIDIYGMVKVADFFDLLGMSCDYTDNKYGWTSLRVAGVTRTYNGYIINLPNPVVLD